jgi:hypothetical protein
METCQFYRNSVIYYYVLQRNNILLNCTKIGTFPIKFKAILEH